MKSLAQDLHEVRSPASSAGPFKARHGEAVSVAEGMVDDVNSTPRQWSQLLAGKIVAELGLLSDAEAAEAGAEAGKGSAAARAGEAAVASAKRDVLLLHFDIRDMSTSSSSSCLATSPQPALPGPHVPPRTFEGAMTQVLGNRDDCSGVVEDRLYDASLQGLAILDAVAESLLLHEGVRRRALLMLILSCQTREPLLPTTPMAVSVLFVLCTR